MSAYKSKRPLLSPSPRGPKPLASAVLPSLEILRYHGPYKSFSLTGVDMDDLRWTAVSRDKEELQMTYVVIAKADEAQHLSSVDHDWTTRLPAY
ncbi:hypothetical protein HJFPF1_00531 [Paramyrothecium foliicola]|nr:hypothetical protein HJFPF1_00531 [Paramyrothecium foliicola]